MTAADVISRVISAKFLRAGLIFIPAGGVSAVDLMQLEAALHRKISAPYAQILQ